MGSTWSQCIKSHHNHHRILQCPQCECSLKKYNHCCKESCLILKEIQSPVLFEILELHNCSYLTKLIMDYLPDDQYTNITITSSNINYKAYGKAMNPSLTLCPIWCKHFLNHKIKIIVLGQQGIGKTSLLQRFVDHTYTETFHDPTIDEYTMEFSVNKQQCVMDICDFDGTETMCAFLNMRDEMIRSGQIFLCCFSIDSKTSYTTALEDRQKILQSKDGYRNWAVILVATKCDLLDVANGADQTIFVNTERVIEQTRRLHIGYIETSAKHNVNIDFLFERSVHEYWVQSESHRCLWDEELESPVFN